MRDGGGQICCLFQVKPQSQARAHRHKSYGQAKSYQQDDAHDENDPMLFFSQFDQTFRQAV
jgi:hypothetical protein